MGPTSKASIPESRERVSCQVVLPQSRWYNGLEDTEHFGSHLALLFASVNALSGSWSILPLPRYPFLFTFDCVIVWCTSWILEGYTWIPGGASNQTC
jgi:hypothetical protein